MRRRPRRCGAIPTARRLATLLATVRHLEAKSVDDTLELLDLLMATELVDKAQNASNKEKVRKHPKLAKAAARLAVAVEVLFESDGWGGADEELRVDRGVGGDRGGRVSRRAARRAGPGERDRAAGGCADPDDWRAELLGRYSRGVAGC